MTFCIAIKGKRAASASEDTPSDDDMMRLLRRAGDAQLQMHESTALVDCLKGDYGATVIEDVEVQMSPALVSVVLLLSFISSFICSSLA